MRPDVFSPDVIEALSKLRDDIPCHRHKHTRRMIKESFGHEIEDIFEEFDPVAVASGTVAQVHRARLRPEYVNSIPGLELGPDGRAPEVAVKVRHPAVLEETWVDTDLIFTFSNYCSSILTIPFKKEEFTHCMQKQVDFTWEAHYLTRFANNFQKEILTGKIQFPVVSPELLSPSILVETWADGRSVSGILTKVQGDFKEIGENLGELADDVADSLESTLTEFSESLREKKARLAGTMKKKKELARTVFDMNMKMFLRDNLVHGDLHAGNVLFSERDNCCTVLDAGLTTSLLPDSKARFGKFLLALCKGDTESITEHLLQFKDADNSSWTDSPEQNQVLRDDMKETVDRFICKSGNGRAPGGGPISLGDVMGQVLFVLQRSNLKLRGDVASSIITMSVSEGLIRSLDPTFDVVGNALPYFVRFPTNSN